MLVSSLRARKRARVSGDDDHGGIRPLIRAHWRLFLVVRLADPQGPWRGCGAQADGHDERDEHAYPQQERKLFFSCHFFNPKGFQQRNSAETQRLMTALFLM
ncbi:hypothetical protein [Methylocystis parvus]|uniref:hypothetical protein n=1 Tax=Methylocystis parvus TaxID=134 RepID=UPI003C74DA4F